MATYLIGDVQGCYDPLRKLLSKIDFNVEKDTLWFTGDLVNRGPKSLETLRFVKNLEDRAITVLGNHDLHLLSASVNRACLGNKDTLDDVLTADDSAALLKWLRHRPLLHITNEYCLVHAGIYPQWAISEAKRLASEIESVLRSNDYATFFEHMYGDTPKSWSDSISGWERLRFITNCFTRMRFLNSEGGFEFRQKGPPGSQTVGYIPWFEFPQRKHASHTILFGHWSSLGLHKQPGVIGADTGCIWDGKLTAICLDQNTNFESVDVDCGCG